VDGLLKRGYTVAIFHRGTHELAEIPPEVEHIHGDPHFLETVEESLHGRSFDLAIVTYGRIRFIAEALAGRVGRFISVGGVASYRGYLDPERLNPVGMSTPVREDAPLVGSALEHRFSHLIVQTEEAVFERHPGAAHFRYPYVYGPRQLVPCEWSIIRRINDRRPHIILADDGLSLSTRGYSENLAHSVLLAVDQPEASAGQIYNCGDEQQFTLRQIVEIIAQKMEREIEIINMPYGLAAPARPLYSGLSTHHRVMDIRKIQAQLGYRDRVPAQQALGRTVEWLLANQPQPGGDLEQRLQDPFDYAGEDRLIDAWRAAVERVAQIPFSIATDVPHPYAHPKNPGERDHRNR
jgi:nucleoside-diphosphate-sugar epimerase